MFFESPRETRRTMFVLTRTELEVPGIFDSQEVCVMIRLTHDKQDEAPSWMNVGEAIAHPHVMIVTHEEPEGFNEDLAMLVSKYGTKGIAGHLRQVPIEVIDRPARTSTNADAAMLRVEARRHPEYNEEEGS